MGLRHATAAATPPRSPTSSATGRKMAVRDTAKALGHSPGQQDAWSKQVDALESRSPATGRPTPRRPRAGGRPRRGAAGGAAPPRHPLRRDGAHRAADRRGLPDRARRGWRSAPCCSGTRTPASRWGWSSSTCSGSGMLGALDHMMRPRRASTSASSGTLATIPKEEPAVYDMLCRADSIGVFQVESRAQIGTLPRLRPREFYDLAIEIALIRPGPIQGGAVHPYIRRRDRARSRSTYAHPTLEPVLERTLGVPLFQEQLMADGGRARRLQPATTPTCCAGRWAPSAGSSGSSRSSRSSTPAWRAAGIVGDAGRRDLRQDPVLRQLRLRRVARPVASRCSSTPVSWFKLHYPAAFLAGLLRTQPMGFYSPQSLVADARRHGVEVRRPDVTALRRAGRPRAVVDRRRSRPPASTRAAGRSFERAEWVPGTPDPTPDAPPRRRARRTARARLGARHRPRGRASGSSPRATSAPFTDITDLVPARRARRPRSWRRWPPPARSTRSGLDRREALWAAGFAEGAEHLPGITPVTCTRRRCPGMSEPELTLADLWAPASRPTRHPIEHLRDALRRAGVRSVAELATAESGRRVHVGRAGHPPAAARAPPAASPSSTSRTRPACST